MLLGTGLEHPQAVSAKPIDKGFRPVTPNPWVPVSSSTAPKCVDHLFVGFRGSGDQPRGFKDDGTQVTDARSWSPADFGATPRLRRRQLLAAPAASDHLGGTLGALYEAFRRRYLDTANIGFYSPGVSDFGILPGGRMTYTARAVSLSSEYIEAITSNSLDSHMAASTAISNYATNCPSTRFIVAGYSQGALMARNFLLKRADSPEFKGRIEAAVLVADPLFRPGDGKKFGLGFDADHQLSGLMTDNSLLEWSSGCLLNRGCVAAKLLTRTLKAALESFNVALRTWKLTSDGLENTTIDQLSTMVDRIGVVCDSGDGVCSPLRIYNGMMIDSDLLDRTPKKFDRHIRYKNKPSTWWDSVVEGLLSNR